MPAIWSLMDKTITLSEEEWLALLDLTELGYDACVDDEDESWIEEHAILPDKFRLLITG